MNFFVQLTIDLLLPLNLCYLTGTHDFALSGRQGLPLKPIMVVGSFFLR